MATSRITRQLAEPAAVYGVNAATISGAFRDGNITAFKMGRLAFLKMNVYLNSDLSTGTILTLPESLKPFNSFTFTFPTQNPALGGGYFEIEIDGRLICYTSPGTGEFLNYDVMYFTAN